MSDPKKMSVQVQKMLKEALAEAGVQVLHITAAGTYNSSFYIAVKTDAERDKLQGEQTLLASLIKIFRNTGFSAAVASAVDFDIKAGFLDYLKNSGVNFETMKNPSIWFESQETVDRDYRGDWFNRIFK